MNCCVLRLRLPPSGFILWSVSPLLPDRSLRSSVVFSHKQTDHSLENHFFSPVNCDISWYYKKIKGTSKLFLNPISNCKQYLCNWTSSHCTGNTCLLATLFSPTLTNPSWLCIIKTAFQCGGYQCLPLQIVSDQSVRNQFNNTLSLFKRYFSNDETAYDVNKAWTTY